MNYFGRLKLAGLVGLMFVAASAIVSEADSVSARASHPYSWGAQQRGLALSVYPLATSVRVGDPMKIAIGLKNSGATIHVFRMVARSDYQFTVVGPNGRAIPMFRYSRRPEDSNFYTLPSSGWELKPGTTYEKTFDIDNNFDVRAPGKYSITAKSEILLGGSSARYASLKSNTIVLTVTK